MLPAGPTTSRAPTPQAAPAPTAHVANPPARLGVCAAVLVGSLVGLGGLLVWGGSRPSSPATSEAVLVDQADGYQVISVLEGPDPRRHAVTWAAAVPEGSTFTVGLDGACGCEPRPAALVGSGDSSSGSISVTLGFVLLVLGTTLAWILGVGQRRMRSWRRRATTVVGVGDGPLVHVLPMWSRFGQAMHGELWPLAGEAPVGRVTLVTTDVVFDPTQPFRLWGSLRPGEPAALTSQDGMQLLLPNSPLVAPEPPGPPPPISTAAASLLGWPNRLGAGEPGRAALVQPAVSEVERRLRLVVGAVVALQVAVLVSALGRDEVIAPCSGASSCSAWAVRSPSSPWPTGPMGRSAICWCRWPTPPVRPLSARPPRRC